MDNIFGANDRDVILGSNVGDFVDGGEGGDDWDTLDLTGTKPTGGSLKVTKDGTNPENGFVEFFDSNGVSTGTMNFINIEDIVPCFTPGTLIATLSWTGIAVVAHVAARSLTGQHVPDSAR